MNCHFCNGTGIIRDRDCGTYACDCNEARCECERSGPSPGLLFDPVRRVYTNCPDCAEGVRVDPETGAELPNEPSICAINGN